MLYWDWQIMGSIGVIVVLFIVAMLILLDVLRYGGQDGKR